MAEKDKRYYWLKLKKDFFKRHDIQIIENMPNGKDYLLFYLKLMCESVDHEGCLRFSEKIPYNEQMLSTITHTNVDIVKAAVMLFQELGMMEVTDDGTYYMNEVEKMLGSETYWAEKKRLSRQALDNVQLLSNSSQTCPSKSKRIDKDKDIDIDKDIYNNKLTNLTIERLFERYFGRTPVEYETESIMHWSESLNVELVGEDIALADVAFRLAAEARTENKMKYIAGIYRKWKSAGVASVDDYETYQAEYDIANGRI